MRHIEKYIVRATIVVTFLLALGNFAGVWRISWWWVFSPMWGAFALALILVLWARYYLRKRKGGARG